CAWRPCGELASQTIDLAAEVARPGRGGLVHGLLGTPVGSLGLRERVRPVALELQDLGAVNEAPAGESQEIGLLLAPARQGRRPLPRAAKVEDVLARKNH